MKRNENVEILTFFAAADIYPSYQRVRPCQVQSIMFPNKFLGPYGETGSTNPEYNNEVLMIKKTSTLD